jgi:hypothetical protein
MITIMPIQPDVLQILAEEIERIRRTDTAWPVLIFVGRHIRFSGPAPCPPCIKSLLNVLLSKITFCNGCKIIIKSHAAFPHIFFLKFSYE